MLHKGGGLLPDKYKSTLHACYVSLITQAVNNNLAPLFFAVFRDQFALSFEMLGRLVLLNFGTQIITSTLSLRFVDRLGYRASAVLAHVLSFLGIISLGILPQVLPSTPLALGLAVFLSGCGGGVMEVVISPIVESLPTKSKAASMSLLHSFYCWGHMAVVILTTLVLWALGTHLWPYLPLLWALIPLFNLFRFLRVPLLPLVPEGERMPAAQLFSSPLFFLCLLLMISAGAAELTMSQWSSLFAEMGLGVPKVLGDLVGPALFALFMVAGRTAYGVLGERISLRQVIMVSCVFCLVCYAVTVFSPLPVLSLLGAALCGLSVSLMWPGTLSLASAQFPKGGTTLFGLLAVFGNVGGSLGPWLTGLVSDLSQRSQLIQHWSVSRGMGLDQAGLRAGLLMGSIFPLLMFLGLIVLGRKKRALARAM